VRAVAVSAQGNDRLPAPGVRCVGTVSARWPSLMVGARDDLARAPAAQPN
jgi:hypothetical protein